MILYLIVIQNLLINVLEVLTKQKKLLTVPLRLGIKREKVGGGIGRKREGEIGRRGEGETCL